MSTKTNKTKAEILLSKVKNATERASEYFPRIKSTFSIELQQQKESILQKIDRINTLSEMSLETNVNSGKQAMTKQQCEGRFRDILGLEAELVLDIAEYHNRVDAFESYFGETTGLRIERS